MEQKIVKIICLICKYRDWCKFDARKRHISRVKECGHIKALLALIAEDRAELVEALKAAKCPNCDGSGVIARQVSSKSYVTRDMAIDAGDRSLEGSIFSKDDFEFEECQWCDERNKFIGD